MPILRGAEYTGTGGHHRRRLEEWTGRPSEVRTRTGDPCRQSNTVGEPLRRNVQICKGNGRGHACCKARTAVQRRHADLRYGRPAELTAATSNATLYQWGYLKQTHALCYWERERAQLESLVRGAAQDIPTCIR